MNAFKKYFLTGSFNLVLFTLVLNPILSNAQLEKVIVEKYYVSDNNDASDITGGQLDSGSVTYRVYVDMAPGSKISKIYGDAYHALKISSTDTFFNNTDRPYSFGKDVLRTRLDENTIALDSWLTIGQATSNSTKTYFGILKQQDTDGSIVGGTNHNGGLFINNDPSAGISLTTSDGLDTMVTVPTGWLQSGILNTAGKDSTIFGSLKPGTSFTSNNAFLQNSGVSGVIPDSNQVLVAQLTTKGSLSFELNVEVTDNKGNTVKYVANDDTLLTGEKVIPTLKYPPVCGCTDPNYLEFKPSYACANTGACLTMAVLGCMDPMACNFNSNANVPVQSMCCYPGLCNDLDISKVCPTLSIKQPENNIEFNLFPDPAKDQLTIHFSSTENKKTTYQIFDSFGKLVFEKNVNTVSSEISEQVDVSNFEEGLYLVRLSVENTFTSKRFIKN